MKQDDSEARRTRAAWRATLLAVSLSVGACSHGDGQEGGGAGGSRGGGAGKGGQAQGGQAQGGQAQGGPPQVGFIIVRQSAVALPVTLSGRAVAYRTSEVRPQVTGLIMRREFREGGLVRAGQPLFEIDPRLYRAAVNQASANLSSARASEQAAAALANRYKPLAKIEAISQQDYTDAVAQARVARAGIAQNAATLDTARINLNFTTVPAPISGRIGRSLFTVGALVTSSQADPLAIIQQLDPMYVDIQQSAASLLALRRSLGRNGVLPARARVRLTLGDGSDFGRVGTIEFTEVTVDQNAGTVTLRARFPNPDGLLLPGMFVRASFAQAIDADAFLVPQPALDRDPRGGASVLVAGPDDKVVRKPVTADHTQGQYWVVTSGIAPGDRIIVQGLGQLRPGQAVRPVPAATPQRVAPPSDSQGDGGGAGGTAKAG